MTWKEREARKVQAKIRRETIRELRGRIRATRAQRREALKAVRRQCRAARVRLRDRVKAYKLAARAKLREDIQAMRLDGRARCRARIDRVKRAGATKLQLERARLAEQRALQAEVSRVGQRMREKHARSVKEVREENDDEVRSNLPAELVPVFDRVRSSIHASPRMSRTERFLHWAEENPDEVVAIQMMAADVATARMIRELQELERQEHKRRTKK